MSWSSDSFDNVDPPLWIAEFVNKELRSFLVCNREAALAALSRWIDHRAKQSKAVAEWETRRTDYLKSLAAVNRKEFESNPDYEKQSKEKERPGPDFQWSESFSDTDGVLKPVWGWLPPELSVDNKPHFDNPLPLPLNRDLSPDECWAALVAIHDETRVKRERLGQEENGEYVKLGLSVRNLEQSHIPQMRRMLEVVTAEVAKESGGEKLPADTDADRPARDPNQPGRDRQNDILAAIRSNGMPLTRPELIDAMKLKTEGKLGANLAWMVTNKVLINISQRGYWPAGEPVPE